MFFHHSRSGVVFTPEVRKKHVDRRWKAYPAGNKGKSPEFEHGAANASDCLKKKYVAVNMDDYPGIACLEEARP